MTVEVIYNQEEQQLTDEVMVLINQGTGLLLEEHAITKEPEITLVITSNEEIRILNRDFRELDRATDVLSFPQYDSLAEIQEEEKEEKEKFPLLLGDIVISLEMAVSQSKEYGHSLTRELVFLYVHGLLHLLGYDHIKATDTQAMRQQEEAIMTKLGLEISR